METPTVHTTGHGDVRIGTFERVLALPDRYLNDHCLVRHDDLWHLFGIVGDSPGGEKKPGRAQHDQSFVHATSPDLRAWRVHDDAMRVSGRWPEELAIIAPFVVAHDGAFHMLYAACDRRGTQRMCLAVSRDLFKWQRHPGNPVIVPSVAWARWPGFGMDEPDGVGSFGGCRDAHVLRLPDGRFIAYWVTRLQESFGPDMVAVAASVSHDLERWHEIGPVFQAPAWHRPLTREIESPCVVYKDGRYWLFFKHQWWTHFVASDTPFDFSGGESTRLGYAHAAEIFLFEDQWWITHCKTDPDDYAQEHSDTSRGLFLGRLDWPDGGEPRLV